MGSGEVLSRASDDDIRVSQLTLRDAQFVVAREYGFDSWAKLKAYVQSDTKGKSLPDEAGPGALESAHRRYASVLTDTLTDVSNESVQVTLERAITSSYETFLTSFDGACCVWRFSIKPDDWLLSSFASVAIDLSIPIAGLLVRHSSPTSDFINEHKKRMFPVVTRIVADFEKIWDVDPVMRVGDAQVSTDPTDIQIAEPDDECLIVPFEVRSAGLETRVNLCYPKHTLVDLVLPYLGGQRVDRFEPVASPGHHILTRMFSEHVRFRIQIDRILDGIEGTVLVDDTTNPTVAHLIHHGDSMFGGDPNSPAAREMVETRRSVRLLPESSAWGKLIEDVYGNNLDRESRIEFSPESLQADHIGRLIDNAPQNVRIERIDTDLVERIKRRLHPQIHDEYASAEDFMRSGSGFCAILDGEPVCCASTELTHRGSAKINLETFRRPTRSTICRRSPRSRPGDEGRPP